MKSASISGGRGKRNRRLVLVVKRGLIGINQKRWIDLGETLELIGILAIVVGGVILVFYGISVFAQPSVEQVDFCIELGGVPEKTAFGHYNGDCEFGFERDGYLVKSTAYLRNGGIVSLSDDVDCVSCCGGDSQ